MMDQHIYLKRYVLLGLEFIVGVVHDKPLFIFNSWLMDKDVHCEEMEEEPSWFLQWYMLSPI